MVMFLHEMTTTVTDNTMIFEVFEKSKNESLLRNIRNKEQYSKIRYMI